MRASLVTQMVKNLLAVRETWIWSLGWEDPLEEGMAIHSSILAWRIPMNRGTWWATQSLGSPRVGHDWATKYSTVRDSITIFIIVLGLFSVGLFFLLCFLAREVRLVFVVKLVLWWWVSSLNFHLTENFWFLHHIWRRVLAGWGILSWL